MSGRTAVVVLGLCAALAASPASRAATIVYDLAGTTSGWRNPLAPQSSPTPGVFTNPVGPGSSLTLDFDANGDGVAGDVTIAASHIVLQHTDNFFASTTPYGSLTYDAVAQLVGGHGQVVGCLGGACIDWDSSATTYSTTGTVTCFGAICSLLGDIGEPAGVPLPYSVYEEFLQAIGYVANPRTLFPNSQIDVGRWEMTSDFGHLNGFCVPFGSTCEGGFGAPVTIASTQSGDYLGLNLEMQAVPEPTYLASLSLALILVALGRSIRR